MQWLGEAWRRLAFFFRRGQFQLDLAKEMDEHLRMKEKDLEENGMAPDQALQAAKRKFGNALLLRERSSDAWGLVWLDNLLQDLRYGVRQLRRNPGFTIVAVLTLALGIGANTAIYSVAYSVLLSDLPVKDPRGLVALKAIFPKWPAGYSQNGHGMGATFSYPALKAFSAQDQAFASVFGFAPPDIGKENLTVDIHGQATTADGVMVTGAYFSGLGVEPALGRAIDRPDEEPGSPRVADISFGYWVRAFGQSVTVIGKKVAVNRTPFTIVGVLPQGFTGAEPGNMPDIWIPITVNANLGPWGGMPASVVYGSGSFAWMTVMGRLKPGVSSRQASVAATLGFQQNLEASLGRRLRPDEMPRIELSPGGRGLDSLRESFSKPLTVLIALAGFLLLLASVNVAALLVARGAARQGEIAVRAALGASRGRLIRQLLTEGVLLALAGGALALVLAKWGSQILVALVSSGLGRISLSAGLSWHVLLFLAAASLLAGILVGTLPAIRSAAAVPILAIKAGTARGNSGGISRRTGGRLVVTQVSLSLLLLAAAGLFVRTLRNVETVDTGVYPRHVLLFGISPVGYSEQRASALYQQLLDRLRALPGVESASVSGFTMFSGWRSTGDVSIVGYHPKPGQYMQVDFLRVGPEFFRTMGIPVIAGRSIRDSDIGSIPKAAVVNREFVRRFFGSISPVGQVIEGMGSRTPIVGVVADARYGSPLRKAPATVYLPTAQGYFEVRTHGDPLALVPTVRRVIGAMAPGVPITGVETQDHEIRGWFMQQRLLATLGGFFGLLGLLLSSLSIYGLIAFRVARRTHEIGIRKAMGAENSDVLKMIIGSGLKLTLIGVAIGIAGAFALARFLGSLLYGVKPTDPLTFVAVSLILILVALLASFIPARRAAKVDPMVALRYE